MKVALVGPTYPYRGGIAHYTTMLHRALIASGHQSTLYSFKRQYPGWLFPGRTDRDPSQLALDVECQYSLDSLNPLTWWTTAQAILAQRPDVLVLQWWVTFFAPMWRVLAQSARRAAIKVVFICHNVLPHERRAWDAWLARWALRLGDGFIVQSQDEKVNLLALVQGRTVEIVSHPIYDMFANRSVPRSEARRKLRLPQDSPVLLFFGLVREYKGLRYLLDAMPAIRAELADVNLLVVGEFWQDKQAYIAQIERLGIGRNVIIVDQYVANEDVPVYFSAADVAVLPYTHVTQSGVVQLAFGFGVPVITTKVGGLPEMVMEGKTGLLVPPQDIAALAHTVCRFFADGLGSSLRVGVCAQQTQSSWTQLVTGIEALVEERQVSVRL